MELLKIGSRGEKVFELQKWLGVEPPDGIFGPMTDMFVENFQRKHGLVIDGVWGPASQLKFNSLNPTVSSVPQAAYPVTMHPIVIAMSDFGVKELLKGDEPKILRYYADVGHSWVKEDEVAWCAAFVGSCLERAGIGSTRALNARSYLKWGFPTSSPRTGDIVVFSRGVNQMEGHVGFYLRTDGDRIVTLGGNQSNSVSVASFPQSSVLGYRKVVL